MDGNRPFSNGIYLLIIRFPQAMAGFLCGYPPRNEKVDVRPRIYAPGHFFPHSVNELTSSAKLSFLAGKVVHGILSALLPKEAPSSNRFLHCIERIPNLFHCWVSSLNQALISTDIVFNVFSVVIIDDNQIQKYLSAMMYLFFLTFCWHSRASNSEYESKNMLSC